MSNVLNYRSVEDPFRPANAFQRVHRFDGIYAGGSSASEQAEYLNGLYDRSDKFRGNVANVPYSFRDGTWAGITDDEEFLRQLSLNQYYYQRYAQFSRGNGYVSPHDYVYLPTIVAYITRWRLEVVEVQLTNPCRIVVRRRPEIYDSYLSHDGLGGSISNRFFTTPTDTHGFGNATTNYTQDGRGIGCLFARLPTNIPGQYGLVMNDLNSGGGGRFGDERYWYLKVITENILEVYFDHTLNSPLNATGWDRIDLSSNAFGIPLCYAQNPTNTNRYYGQMVHLDAFNFGRQRWINDAGEPQNPQIEFFHSIAGDWSQTAYPFRVEVAGVVTNKMSTGNSNARQYRSRSFAVDNISDDRYVPAITTTIDNNGVLNSATFNPVFSGLFTQWGGEYVSRTADEVKGGGVSFADAHVIKFTASNNDKVAAGLTGISGTADKPSIPVTLEDSRVNPIQNIVDGEGGREGYFINTENDFEWTEPLTHRVTISNIMHSPRADGRPSNNRGRLNGEPLSLRKVGPKRFEVLRLVNGVASRIGISETETLSGGVLLLRDTNSLDDNDLSYNMGGPVTSDNSRPGNTQIWPSMVPPNSVKTEYIQPSYNNISLSGQKYTTSVGARGYKIMFDYNFISIEDYKVFENFVKSMSGQVSQFRLPTSMNNGKWTLFESNQDHVDLWETRNITALKDHFAGENTLFLTGFEPETAVLRGGDHITWEDSNRDYTKNILTESSQDVVSNKFGEARVRLSQPLQENINANSRFAVFQREYLNVTLDSDTIKADYYTHTYASFRIGFHVVL